MRTFLVLAVIFCLNFCAGNPTGHSAIVYAKGAEQRSSSYSPSGMTSSSLPSKELQIPPIPAVQNIPVKEHGETKLPIPDVEQNTQVQPLYENYAVQNQNAYAYGGIPSSQQLFGISSNGDFSISAYFGPVFWGCVTGALVSVLLIWIINCFSGFDILSKAIETGITGRSVNQEDGKLKGKSKSLDMDQLSEFVYNAIEKYKQFNQIVPKP